eukprot:15454689-Alexandrium_andersonii.AAC.1
MVANTEFCPGETHLRRHAPRKKAPQRAGLDISTLPFVTTRRQFFKFHRNFRPRPLRTIRTAIISSKHMAHNEPPQNPGERS